MTARRLLKGTFSSGLYRISAIGIGFLISVVSARLLGVDGYGILQFVLSVIQLAQLGLGLGMATQVLRASGEEDETSDPGALDVLIKRSVTLFLILLFLISLPGLAIWGWMDDPAQLALLGAAAAFAITQHLLGVYRSALVGKSRFMDAGFGEFLAGIGALVLLGGLLAFASTQDLDPGAVLLVRTGTAGLGSLFLYLSWNTRRAVSDGSKAPVVDWAAMFDMARVGFPVMLIGVGAILNSSADIILLGLMRSSAEVGEYHVATRAAGLIGLPLAVMMAPFSPIISKLHRTNRRELRAVFFWTTALVGAGSLLVAVLLIVFMKQFLGLFGPEFLGAGNIAITLGIAQLINAGLGPMQQLLIMTGFEKTASRAMFAGVATNIVLNLILIPPFGGLGAAAGTGVGIAFNSVLNAASVWREMFSERALAAVSAEGRN
jgi:O-antigen/teichoic acid export membrane protein